MRNQADLRRSVNYYLHTMNYPKFLGLALQFDLIEHEDRYNEDFTATVRKVLDRADAKGLLGVLDVAARRFQQP